MSDLPAAFSRNQLLPPEPEPDLGDFEDGDVIVADADEAAANGVRVDPKTGAISIDTDDGGVVVDLRPEKPRQPSPSDKFYDNLAETLDDDERNRIVDEVMRGIEADDQSRQEWLDNRRQGIEMLGLKIEKATGDVGNSTGPFEGMSTVRHPLLLESVVRFQSNAAAELYPPTGPVKVRDDRPPKPAGVTDMPTLMGYDGGASATIDAMLLPPGALAPDPNVIAALSADRETLAEALEKGFNHNLTIVDRGYRPDSVRMLFWVGFGGCAFKKVYFCPIKMRPVSRFVDAADIIVSNAVSDYRDAGRITHRITMSQALVRRMQIVGAYRDVALHEPQFQPNAVDEAKAEAQGLTAIPQRQEDQPRTIYESYVELDIRGHEHTDKRGDKTGIPLPYKVSIDKDSRTLLEVRRNWEEDDETLSAKTVFVKFSFIPATGFYDIGLLQLLGNGDKALTAAWRVALDAGMFGNFPGFLYNEGALRNWTNQNRVPPGGGIGIKGIGNLPLDQVIKPLPYKEIGAGMVALVQHIEQRMDRVAGTAELPVGEGRQDAPVGTTLALIEQATKVLAAVHINLHAAQAEEFQLLKKLYQQNPDSFWRWNKSGRRWEEAEFLKALEDCELVPAADPNTPSHMIRLMRAQAVKMTAMARPDLYDMRKVDRWLYEMIGVSDPDEFFAPPPPPQQPPPDPAMMAAMAEMQVRLREIQQKAAANAQQLQLKSQEAAAEHQARMTEIAADMQAKMQDRRQDAQVAALQSADRAADRASEERRQTEKLQTEMLREHIRAAHAQRPQPPGQEQQPGQPPGLSAPPPG